MLETLQEKISPSVRGGESMVRHTTFKVGGPAEFFFEAKSSEELERAATVSKELDLPLFVFGGGSNMLVSEEGIKGLVVKTANQAFHVDGETVVAESGVPTGLLSMRCAEHGLTGFEWAVGVPGRVGGAVRGNAGAYGGEMKDVVTSVRVWKPDGVVEMTNAECAFGYRDSVFKREPKWIVLSTTLRLAKGEDLESVKARLKRILLDRKEKQPVEFPTAGCMFANWRPESSEELASLRRWLDLDKDETIPVAVNGTVPAGWIVEKAQLKGTKVGKVRVSEKHGNFFLSENGATADDVVALTATLKTRVRNMTEGRVQLHEEVEYVGF